MPAPSASSPAPAYLFATCREGSEKSLKAEVAARLEGSLRTAFMRPQLVTWKVMEPLAAATNFSSVYARVAGISLGMEKTGTSLAEHLQGQPQFGAASFHFHVYPRVTHEDGLDERAWAVMDAWRQARAESLLKAGFAMHPSEARPKSGEIVLNAILGQPGEPAFLGWHQHQEGRHSVAGGLPRLTLPPEAPSRAWLKLEQALAWAGWDEPEAWLGKAALELGCSPGGAGYALVRRGVHVTGVDPAPVDPRVLALIGPGGARLQQLVMPVGALGDVPLPNRVHLLLCDMNVAPPVVIRTLERIQHRLRAPRLIINLKMNDLEMERRLPEFLGQLRRFLPAPLHATQLAANRCEVCVVAGAP